MFINGCLNYQSTPAGLLFITASDAILSNEKNNNRTKPLKAAAYALVTWLSSN